MEMHNLYNQLESILQPAFLMLDAFSSPIYEHESKFETYLLKVNVIVD